MAITSENHLIDLSTINKGCEIIRAASEDYKKCADRIKEAAATCTPAALSVEGKSMQPSLEELATAVAQIQQNIISFANAIAAAAVEIYGKQSEELRQYQAKKAQEASGNTTGQ